MRQVEKYLKGINMGTATLLSVEVIDEVESNQQVLSSDNAV